MVFIVLCPSVVLKKFSFPSSSNSARFRVTGHARWILSFDIVARDAALHIPPRFLCMESATRAHPDCGKPGYVVCSRSESGLVDISSGYMAISAERLRLVACHAFRLARLCIDPVGKPVVQIMDILQNGLIR
jgi:hypothetical protein